MIYDINKLQIWFLTDAAWTYISRKHPKTGQTEVFAVGEKVTDWQLHLSSIITCPCTVHCPGQPVNLSVLVAKRDGDGVGVKEQYKQSSSGTFVAARQYHLPIQLQKKLLRFSTLGYKIKYA